jgi:hypothetical protein
MLIILLNFIHTALTAFFAEIGSVKKVKTSVLFICNISPVSEKPCTKKGPCWEPNLGKSLTEARQTVPGRVLKIELRRSFKCEPSLT